MAPPPSLQLDLFERRPDERGLGGTEAAPFGVGQAGAASAQHRAVTQLLMDQLCHHDNLRGAYERVKTNRGAPGIDAMTVEDLTPWLVEHEDELVASLKAGTYQPQPLRSVDIDKPGGGKRLLRIPTVVDRLVQQALLQVLQPLFEPNFSDSSFGFRPGRSAHQALKQAQEHVRAGYEIVVDIDLERFFDTVNQDRLMASLARRIQDKGVLRLIHRILQTGVFDDGLQAVLGLAQGGPLSPLLSNVVLEALDQELERRGHRFCRYADDCNIYVRSQRAAQRVRASITRFLEGGLRLRVNRAKSAIGHASERAFLGHRVTREGLEIAPKSVKRLKDRIRAITRRNRGVRLSRIITEVNRYTRGWVGYFRQVRYAGLFRDLDGWIRRKLRCYRLKQCNRVNAVRRFLQGLGVPSRAAWLVARSGKGWWRKSISPPVYRAMTNRWFKEQGLVSLSQHYATLAG